MRYLTTHPDLNIPEQHVKSLLEKGFEDVSWKNDECPRFIKQVQGGRILTVWLADKAQGFDKTYRVDIDHCDEQGAPLEEPTTVMEDNDFNHVLTLIRVFYEPETV